MNKKTLWVIPALLIVSLLLAGCGVSGVPLSLVQRVQVATTPVPPSVGTPMAPAAVQGNTTDISAFESTLERLYAQTIPSVVNIDVTEAASASSGNGNSPFGQTPQGQAQEALGSGFVWDKQGHIVTNNHVVAGASRIVVTFHDGTSAEAKLVGADPDSDLAVIQVNVPADKLQPVQMADSTLVKVGQLSVAIGNPFGLEGSMSVGFVSGLGRTMPVDNSSSPQTPNFPTPGQGQGQGQGTTTGTYSIPDVIQTDAPINPGNSGGVLIDDQGRVIGVTSAIISPVRASAGVGFAIPSAIVQQVVPALIQNGRYDHPYLGISGTTVTLDIAQAMKLDPNQHGALVVNVVQGGPSANAGLRASTQTADIQGQQVPVGGDIITAMDGQQVNSFDDLIAFLSRSTHPGQTVHLTVLRDGKQITVDVTLGKRPTQ